MNISDKLKTLSLKLSTVSEKTFANPYEAIQWPSSMNLQQWFMSPELISIYSSDIYENLPLEQKMKLSFYEAVNFFSININGEKPLVEGLAKRIYGKTDDSASRYFHHFLDEENKHMIYFGTFCERYAGKRYQDKKFKIDSPYEKGEEDFLFFTKTMIFEEIVDVYNLKMSQDDRLEPTVKKINLLHHLDEVRHLVFGRQMVKELFFEYKKKWSPETLANLRTYLASYLVSTWSEYYNPDVYKDAGLSNPYEIREQAMNDIRAKEHRKRICDGCVRFLMENEILVEEPRL